MKIAFVYDAAYPFVKGGGERRIYELAKRLAEKHEVCWITLRWWNSGNSIEIDGINYISVGKCVDFYTKRGRRRISEALYFGRKVLPALMRERYDVVDCTAFPYFPCFSARFYSMLRNTRLFITWHEVWGDYWLDYLGKLGHLGKFVEKRVAMLKAKHIAVSNLTRRELEKLGASNVVVVPNGVDFKRIESVRPAEEKWDIVFAGRLIREKGVDKLIKSVAELRKRGIEAKTLIIGNGPERRNLEKLSFQLGVDNLIRFVKFVEDDRLYSLMKSARVFVLPSMREGFGVVVLEAMACGLPVVTLDHPMNAAADLVREIGFGCVAKTDELIDKIYEVLNGKIPPLSRERLEKYHWDSVCQLLEKTYYRV